MRQVYEKDDFSLLWLNAKSFTDWPVDGDRFYQDGYLVIVLDVSWCESSADVMSRIGEAFGWPEWAPRRVHGFELYFSSFYEDVNSQRVVLLLNFHARPLQLTDHELLTHALLNELAHFESNYGRVFEQGGRCLDRFQVWWLSSAVCAPVLPTNEDGVLWKRFRRDDEEVRGTE